MEKWAFKILAFLVPPSDDASLRSWRFSVFTSILTLFVLIAYIGSHHGLLAWAGVPAGSPTHAQVDDKIAQAVEPLKVQIERTNKIGQAILRALYLPQIRAKVRERCDTTDPQKRMQINTEIDRIRTEYFMLSGERLSSTPSCDEV